MSRDSRNLKKHKEMFPSLKDIPDKEFSYIDGRWYISLNGMKRLAFIHKRPDLLKIAKEADQDAKNAKI